MPIQQATDKQIDAFIRTHADWTLKNSQLERSFQFRGFAEAFGFMAEIALIAERQNHHPDWRNVYNKVIVALSTHEAGGITERDFLLAKAVDQCFEQRAIQTER